MSVERRTVVITGATSGLGLVAARLLAAAPGWTVALPGRDPRRTAEAAAAVGGVALPLDLAHLATVRAFPEALRGAGLPPLGAIVANAGVQARDRTQRTADGFELTFGTNHLGHFALLRALLPHLADDGRIVLVGSATHKAQRLRNFGFPPPRWRHPRELATPGPGAGTVAYATSKLANTITVFELRRRLPELRPGARIAVHGFDPGLMADTGLAREYPAPIARAYRALAPLVAALPGATTATASGAQLARLVTAPQFAAPPGRYRERDRDGAPSSQATDPQLGRELWTGSEEVLAGRSSVG